MKRSRQKERQHKTTQIKILNSIRHKMWNKSAGHQDLFGTPLVHAEFEGHWLTGMRNMNTHLEKQKALVHG